MISKSDVLAGGSGSAYIYGYCDKNWRPGMSEAECKAFVVQAISHAMARDGSSGGNIRTVVINKDGVKRDFLDGTQVCFTSHFLVHAMINGWLQGIDLSAPIIV